MSTKLYNAYRVSKKVDILKLFKKFTDISTNWMASSKVALHAIHGIATDKAIKKIEMAKKLGEPIDHIAERFLEKGNKSLSLDIWLEMVMEEAELDRLRGNPLSIKFECSFSWDKKYWYIVFFPNNFANRMMEQIEKQCKELEDYSYQNQTDPPKDVPYRSYKNRIKKWEALMDNRNNFSQFPSYTIFDSNRFRELIQRYYFTKEKNIFKHLAYKFDSKFEKLK